MSSNDKNAQVKLESEIIEYKGADIDIKKQTNEKNFQIESLSMSIADINLRSKNNSVTGNVRSGLNPPNHKDVKMNDDPEEGWEQVGGRKKSKSRSKQALSNNPNLHQNGISMANQKPQAKDSSAGHKSSQRKASTPTSNSSLNHRKTIDRKEKSKPSIHKQKDTSSAGSNTSPGSTLPKPAIELPITSDGSIATDNAAKSAINIHRLEETNQTLYSDGLKTLSTQSVSISNMSRDNNNILDSLDKNSVINETQNNQNSINGFNEMTMNNKIQSNSSCKTEECIVTNLTSKENNTERTENEINEALKLTALTDENLNYAKEEIPPGVCDMIITSNILVQEKVESSAVELYSSSDARIPDICDDKQFHKDIPGIELFRLLMKLWFQFNYTT